MISDVDGTVVRPDKSLSDATIEAARRLALAGIPMSLISARPPSGIVPLAKALGLTGPIAAFNGGTIVTSGGILLSASRLAADASKTAISLFESAGVTIWVYADGQWFANNPANPHNQREVRAAMIEPVITRTFDALHGRIDKIVAVSDDFAHVRELEGQAKEKLGGRATVSRSQDYFCDITHPAANKGAGVARLAARFDIALTETAIIGDMPNDIPMLLRAGLAIAMGQAPDEVKAAADWITDSNAEDGVTHAIDQILDARAHDGAA
ncbi:Cof-type HAD-IIB family hydrolase [Sphingomonas oryzagri]